MDIHAIRIALETAIEGLIEALDLIDGDADLEPETDFGADDFGEPTGECWLERRA